MATISRNSHPSSPTLLQLRSGYLWILVLIFQNCFNNPSTFNRSKAPQSLTISSILHLTHPCSSIIPAHSRAFSSVTSILTGDRQGSSLPFHLGDILNPCKNPMKEALPFLCNVTLTSLLLGRKSATDAITLVANSSCRRKLLMGSREVGRLAAML